MTGEYTKGEVRTVRGRRVAFCGNCGARRSAHMVVKASPPATSSRTIRVLVCPTDKVDHTEPTRLLASEHELMVQPLGAPVAFACTCGARFDDSVADAFAHGRAVGYRLGRVEEQDTALARLAKAIPDERQRQFIGEVIVPSRIDLEAYRKGPLSPKKGARK